MVSRSLGSRGRKVGGECLLGGRGAPLKCGRIHTEFPRRRWRRAQDVEDRLEVSEVRVVARSIFGYRWVSVDRGSSVSGGRWRKSWWWRVVGLVVGCRWVSVEGRRRRVVGGESVCRGWGGRRWGGGGERHHPYTHTHTHGAATILGFRVRRQRAEDGRRSTEVSSHRRRGN